MAKDILMPALSPSMTEGTLVEWLKKEGDSVKVGDVLGTVQTDKTTMDLEAFDAGVLLKILVPAGSTVPINAKIGVIGKKDEKVEASAPETAKPEKSDAPPAAITETEAPPHAEKKEAAPIAAEPAESGGRIKASPLAKKVAAENGVSLQSLNGSGPGGRIVRADVLNAKSAAPAPSAASPAKAAAPVPVFAPLADQKIKLTPMRAVIAKRLLESKTTIPHFYLQIDVDAKPQVEFRTMINDTLSKQNPPLKLSFNDLVLKAATEAVKRVPAVNASFEGDSVKMFGDINLSFAVAIADGLITPVIRQAQNKSLLQIAAEAKVLATKARDGKLKPEDYSGGTFTLSNLGSYGIDSFCAIINPPQAGILAVGNIVKKPVVDDKDQIVVGYRQSFTLSCDHRVIDGAVAAEFLKAFRELIEKPMLMLL